MIDLKGSNITDILPEYLSDMVNVKAIGYAIQKANERLIGYCKKIFIFSCIDDATNDVLNMLALELGTQYYDDNLDIATKRKLVKNTLVWYMTSGTASAVEELIQIVFGEGEVIEWFEQNGTPGTFDIRTNGVVTEDAVNYFLSLILKVKNTRSHLGKVLIGSNIRGSEYTGAAFVGYIEQSIPAQKTITERRLRNG